MRKGVVAGVLAGVGAVLIAGTVVVVAVVNDIDGSPALLSLQQGDAAPGSLSSEDNAPPCAVELGESPGEALDDDTVRLDSVSARTATTIAAVALGEERSHEVVAWALAEAVEVEQGPAEPLTVDQASALLDRVEGRSQGSPPPASLALARVLDGSRPAALSCAYTRPDVPEEEMGQSGLTPRAAALRKAFEDVFGPLPLGGFAPGGVDSGHVDNSAHYDGRAIDVFFRPMSPANTQRGWVFAHWVVAHAEQYGLLSAIFDDRIWTVWASDVGWRAYRHPSGNTTDPVLRHLDHAHVAVVRGGDRGWSWLRREDR